jgi:hypothetical protein
MEGSLRTVTTPSSLKSFLRQSKNSRSREFLLTSRVIHDLMVAAAARNYDLLVYTPTVDSDGFDLTLDDRDRLVPLQLKSIAAGGKKKEWDIHRKLLRPDRREVEWFGFEPSPAGEGRSGGVLLIEATPNEHAVAITYFYTDIQILTAFWLDLIPTRPKSKKRLLRLRQELMAEPGGMVKVRRSAFLKAKSPEHLLALAGLHSRFRNSWPDRLIELARHQYQNHALSMPVKRFRSLLKNDLMGLILR